MKWTKDRVEELKILQTLIMEIQSINTSNRALERIQKCIEIAGRLDHSEIVDTPRASFMVFLNDIAAHDQTLSNHRPQRR